MKNVFVSLPWHQDQDDAYMREAQRVCLRMYCNLTDTPESEVNLMDSIFHTGSPIKSLSKSIEVLADADLVIFDPNWRSARGCMIEEMVAGTYGIDRYYL